MTNDLCIGKEVWYVIVILRIFIMNCGVPIFSTKYIKNSTNFTSMAFVSIFTNVTGARLNLTLLTINIWTWDGTVWSIISFLCTSYKILLNLNSQNNKVYERILPLLKANICVKCVKNIHIKIYSRRSIIITFNFKYIINIHFYYYMYVHNI